MPRKLPEKTREFSSSVPYDVDEFLHTIKQNEDRNKKRTRYEDSKANTVTGGNDNNSNAQTRIPETNLIVRADPL